MNSGMSKLSPFKKDPKQRATIKVKTVADRLMSGGMKPQKMAGK